MLLQLLLVVAASVDLASSSCSYDKANLTNWNTAGAWDSKVPEANEYAVIRSGKHVRLNVSPPDLKGITIEKNASLVWGNYDNLVVTTDHIHVQGKFIIGDSASNCRFTKKAHIRLTGKSDTNNTVPKFGRKFIGVDEHGSVEFHGAEKKSWTKLIQTMKAAVDTCGVVFNFKDSIYDREMANGLFAMVFNLNGSVYDFSVFRTQSDTDLTAEDEFESFINSIPTNKILVVAVNGDLGTGTVTRNWDKIYTAVETVGGLTSQTALRSVQCRGAYAFITKTGDSSTTQEQYVAKNNNAKSVSTGRMKLYESSSDLQFSVVGTVFSSSGENRGFDIRVLHGDVAYPVIKLFDDVSSWDIGDSIVIASTDFDWKQAEEFKLINCSTCDENEVRLDHEFEYLHYGEETQGIDERGEVGMLTQSILIEGILEDECYVEDNKDQDLCDIFKKDTHGGHFKAIRGFEAVHVENVELYHMGQQKFLGSYALYFHMCDNVNGNWFRYNSIHHCESRCVAIQGSDHSEVTGNVCYLTKGHSIFEEDSAEQWNIIDGNLVIGTEFGSLLLSDMSKDWVNDTMKPFANALSSYWLTHPNNYIRNNVAAGSENTGFWLVTADEPLGPSKKRQLERGLVGTKHAFHSQIAEFVDCCAHSNKGRGLRISDRISNGQWSEDVWVPENGVFTASTSHNPRDPPNGDGILVTSIVKRFTGYKNVQNVYTKAGNLVMDHFSLADAPRGLAMARSVEQTFTEIKNSLFIGETDNLGLPKAPWGRSFPGPVDEAWLGVEFYQGPGHVTDCFLDKYTHKNSTDGEFRPAGALTFKRNTPYSSAPNSGVSGVKYGYCDAVDTPWVFQGNSTLSGLGNRDGNRQASFHDYDGSVTGTVGTQIVQNDPFFLTDRCSKRDWWNLHVCPYEYARAIFMGKGGVFDTEDGEYALYMRRDSRPDAPFSLIGERRDDYLVMKNESYIVTFNGTIPDEIEVSGENLELGDYLRIGFCFSPDSEFTFYNGYHNIAGQTPAINASYTDDLTGQTPTINASSIDDLDSDTTGQAYFWDSTAGLLFVKLIGWSPVLDKENCPGMTCPSWKITRTAGTAGSYDCYEAAYGGNGKYKKQPDGYGVPVAASTYPTETFNSTCYEAPTHPASTYKGCFVDSSRYMDLPHAEVELAQSLTVDLCVQRCYHRNYAYAAMQNASRCLCGNFFGAYDETPDNCIKPCPGNTTQTCGNMNRNSVYSTGRTAPTALAKCGPGATGAVIGNKCYYLTSEETPYTDGERACVKIGGNLATITSEAVQLGVEQYMRPKKVNAWFGLNDIADEGTLVYVDGTSVGSYDNTMIGQGGGNGTDGYVVQANAMYSWNDRGVSEFHRALCELEVNAVPPSGADCGTNNYGKKFGSGLCYAVLNTTMSRTDAEYACYTRMGSLITVDDTNRADVLQHVLVHGDKMDYWVANVNAEDSYVLAFDLLYGTKVEFASREHGAVCLIETISASNPCSTDWKRENSKCYLYTARSALRYDDAEAICKQGASDIVKIHSLKENDFVSRTVNNNASTHVFLGFKYNDTSTKFEWTDGSTDNYTSWQPSHGDEFAKTKGKCARIHTLSGLWKNWDCLKGGSVMCEAPAGY